MVVTVVTEVTVVTVVTAVTEVTEVTQKLFSKRNLFHQKKFTKQCHQKDFVNQKPFFSLLLFLTKNYFHKILCLTLLQIIR